VTPAAVSDSHADPQPTQQQQQQGADRQQQQLREGHDVAGEIRHDEALPGEILSQPLHVQQQQLQVIQQAEPPEQQVQQDCQQEQQQQPAGIAVEAAALLSVPVPKQLGSSAPRVTRRKSGSTMAGLLSSGRQQQQQQQRQCDQPAALQHRFYLPYLQPGGVSVSAPAAAPASTAVPGATEDGANVLQEQQQQQQQAPVVGAAAVTGLQVRSVVDQLMAEAAEGGGLQDQAAAAGATGTDKTSNEQQQQQQRVAEQGTGSGADTDAEEPTTAGAGLADLDYLPLSGRHKHIVHSMLKQPKQPQDPAGGDRQQHTQQPAAQPAANTKRKVGHWWLYVLTGIGS
jgi:hypothetical protein